MLSRRRCFPSVLTAFGLRGWLLDQVYNLLTTMLSRRRFLPPVFTALGLRGWMPDHLVFVGLPPLNDDAFSSEVFSICVDRFPSSWMVA